MESWKLKRVFQLGERQEEGDCEEGLDLVGDRESLFRT